MSPSHQIRVQQNNCDHKFPYMHMKMILDFPDIKDGRVCEKCGIDWDKAHNSPKIVITSNPLPNNSSWIRDRFISPSHEPVEQSQVEDKFDD